MRALLSCYSFRGFSYLLLRRLRTSLVYAAGACRSVARLTPLATPEFSPVSAAAAAEMPAAAAVRRHDETRRNSSRYLISVALLAAV